ncbi:uncharacterized protein LOC110051125 isoform X6 [Orbicella faveolata]|uniref:uncharacterized protein LOC110051125 isoform X6 n=1 Tax=Orbicella faveolata TaxID=48498 RepID=UPI0009E357E3|nr:uncharacterized protein LOC110051125 isoform X6 [Orbicella faveolata]
MALSKTNTAVVLLVGFVNYLEWAVVMTSIYPYILSLSKNRSSAAVYLSLAQSLFPLGQGISQPLASLLVKKLRQIKIVLVASLIIAIGGNVMYIAAQKANSVLLIILGRALAGFGAASATFLPNFSKNALGKATGLDEFSAPAALTILSFCVSLILVTFALDETNCSPIGGSNDDMSVVRSLKSRGVLLGLMLYLLNGYITTWVGFVLPLVAYNHFQLEVMQYGWLMVGVSGTATVASLSMALLSKAPCMANNKNGERLVLIACYMLMITAIVVSYLGGPSILNTLRVTVKEALFIGGVIMVFLTYSVAGVILPSLTTKYVAKSMMPVIMPYCITAMSIGKVIAPLLSKAELTIQGWELLFMGSAGLTFLGVALFLFLYRPPEPEETQLLPENRRISSLEVTLIDSVEQGLMNPQD